jgi:acyl-CoA thioester hydrolase
VSEPFRLLLRVRYNECDLQGIVFNARWGDYADIASGEYMRALFGSVDPAVTGADWRLVKQTTEWRAPARYDDVLDIRVHTLRVGTTSFVLATEYRRHADGALLAGTETTCVMVDPAGQKRAIAGAMRETLERGAPGVIVDHAAAVNRDRSSGRTP